MQIWQLKKHESSAVENLAPTLLDSRIADAKLAVRGFIILGWRKVLTLKKERPGTWQVRTEGIGDFPPAFLDMSLHNCFVLHILRALI
jgi:hypothetical protein